VPDDLSVVGFDDIPVAALFYPSLTTIAQPQREMGRQAMNMCLALIAAGEATALFSDIVVQGRLIVRESSGAREPNRRQARGKSRAKEAGS
jgi:DNA-binding LacI/PurR family transcriptional regulator